MWVYGYFFVVFNFCSVNKFHNRWEKWSNVYAGGVHSLIFVRLGVLEMFEIYFQHLTESLLLRKSCLFLFTEERWAEALHGTKDRPEIWMVILQGTVARSQLKWNMWAESITKFGETEELDYLSHLFCVWVFGGLLVTDWLLQLIKVAEGCWE